jgi:hypothetical protein
MALSTMAFSSTESPPLERTAATMPTSFFCSCERSMLEIRASPTCPSRSSFVAGEVAAVSVCSSPSPEAPWLDFVASSAKSTSGEFALKAWRRKTLSRVSLKPSAYISKPLLMDSF